MGEIDILKIRSADVNRAVEIGGGVWWVGKRLPDDIFQCHAYLIEHGGNSVLIDPGGALTFDAVRAKVEEVIPFSSVRYFVCSHQDPDITASLKLIEALPGLNPEAEIVTHWRARELLRHYDLKTPFYEIEEHGYRLDLGGRVLFFVFTPYLHFPGAFCTFDAATGIMFTSDLFGGMTRDWRLAADDESYFEEVRPFHEHYMPAREILVHGLMKIEECPVKLIAPQHGSLIHGDLIKFVIGKLKQLDCGVFALAGDSTDVRRLSFLNRTLRDITNAVIMYRDFRDVANALADVLRRTLPVSAIEFYGAGAGGFLHLAAETRFRGAAEEPPEEIRGLIGAMKSEWRASRKESYARLFLPAGPLRARGAAKEPCLAIPLFSPDTGRADAAAVVRLAYGVEMTGDMDRLLERMAETFAVAVERETLYRALDAERSRFYEQSIRDPLTGLYSRFYMDETLKRLASGHDRDAGSGLAVALIDLDGFRRVNGVYGHIAGDEAIKEAASAIRACTRASDMAVRYGGEEFAVFMQGNDAEGATALARKIRAEISTIAFTGGLTGLRLTVSVGVTCREQGEEIGRFLQRADRALYQAKASGRDTVVCLTG